MTFFTRNALVAIAVILAPLYGVWILGGALADRAGQRRTTEHLKGDQK